jgi:beta propeller domain-containing protein
MHRVMRFAAVPLAILAVTGPSEAAPALSARGTAAPTRQVLTSFGSEEELARFLAKVTRQQRGKRLRAEREAERQRRAVDRQLARLVKEREELHRKRETLGEERFARELARLDDKFAKVVMSGETVTVAAAAAPSAPVINLQEPGVDEGGLVKRHGDHLVILRRGRLFTVAIANNELRPVSAVDAFDPRIKLDPDSSSTWYDELLISGDRIVVIGYSYERGGTEIGVFGIDASGNLRHRGTYHLRSGDYYTVDNYATRLIGTRLILYTFSAFDGEAQGAHGFPELRKWTPAAGDDEFQRIAASNRVYRPARRMEITSDVILHSVTSCDLASPELTCEASVVLGGPQRAFYVSRSAVYVWTADSWQDPASSRSTVYRIPIDGAAPSALGVRGTPLNQFSFLESENRFLNVVVAESTDRRRQPASGSLDMSLLRIGLEQLADGSTRAPQSSYIPLGPCQSGQLANRFVGPYVLVSCIVTSADDAVHSTVNVVRLATQEVVRLDVPLWAVRMEPIGEHAIIIGPPRNNWTDLRLATIRLDGQPMVADRFTLTSTSETEHRSHAFAYLPETATDGLLGLPVTRAAEPDGEKDVASDAILFLRSRSLVLEDGGLLTAGAGQSDDACRTSCLDWYGNARPVFVGDRVFALLGYELVEGTMMGDRIVELRRASFAPQGARAETVVR